MSESPRNYEAEVAPGLESIAVDELRAQTGRGSADITSGPGFVAFQYRDNPANLIRLKTVNAVYERQFFPVQRPKALLGHQHFQRLIQMMQAVLRLHPPGIFQTLGIDAAGSESSVMLRLKSELASAVNLKPTDERGDLLFRLRRARGRANMPDEGWEALLRLTPRPLATRPWRVRNYEGALNAAVAHAMIRLTEPTAADVFVNLASGSATLLIERAAAGTATHLIGVDHDPVAMDAACANLTAAQVTPTLLQADITTLPLATGTVDKLCADLPFGQLTGSHDNNRTLYPALLAEAARIARPAARFVIITHELRLIESILHRSSDWETIQTLKITLNGLHPRIDVLRKI